MNTRAKRLIGIGFGLTLAAGAATNARADDAAAAAAAAPGVWQKHEYSFRFMGFTSTYSCDGLADQLKRLLTLAGARGDAKSEPGVCASGFGRPDKFANAKLTFYTLAPAATGATAEAAGAWRPVSLSARRPPDLQPGDCELVEQFRDEVLKKMFAIRNLADNTRCIPHQESGSLIDLRFETFAAVAGAPTPAAAAPSVFVYPKAGQTNVQQAKDRAECNATAVAQSGFDPAQPGAMGSAGQSASYATALTACLEPRGYTVR
jgi:hypothetical protein